MRNFLVLLSFLALVCADSIPIYSTGTNNDGSLATPGSVDSHYVITITPHSSSETPAYVENSPHYSGYVSVSGAQYLGESGNLDEGYPVGDIVYQTTFDLTGLDPSTAVLTGSFAVDDYLELNLNGADTGVGCWVTYHPACFEEVRSFTINSGFVAGINTLTVATYNTGGPAGVVLQVSGTANALSPSVACQNANQADWTYGQGYYCWNQGAGFIQCWGEDPVQSSYQDCAEGTSCQCASGVECSNHGTQSPCN